MPKILRRLLLKTVWVAVVFLGITVVSFWVIHLAPGSPTDLQTTMNPQVTPEARARLEKLYGLDQPVHVQYARWLARLATFDFGQSVSGDNRPVWDKIEERLPLTFGMNVASLVLTLLLAVPIGVLTAGKQNRPFDRALTVLVFAGFALAG
jgi:peptide/nickel transport system permease protein